MKRIYFKYDEVKYLPNDYIVNVNLIHLHVAQVVSDLKGEYEIGRLVNNIVTSFFNNRKKRTPTDTTPIKIGDLKRIFEVCEDTSLKVSAHNDANILLKDIKYSLNLIISEEKEHLGEIVRLLEDENTTLNQILDLTDKVPSVPFKEACLLLYKFKVEEYYDQKISALETEKTKEVNAIKRVLESKK